MIASSDVLVLPPDVVVSRQALTDNVRGNSWPLNETAAFVLGRAGRPVGVTVRELSRASGRPVDDVRADVLRFVSGLNELGLANLERGGSRWRRLRDWLGLAVRLVPAGAFPLGPTRRRPIDTRTVTRAVMSCFAALVPRALAVTAAACALVLPLALPVSPQRVAGAILVASTTGFGLGLHEAAHAALLCGVPSAIVTSGRRTYVLHRALAPWRCAAVAAAGPLLVAGVGAAWVTVGAAASAPWLAAGGCPLAAHAIALTVACGDGRAACGL